MRTRLSPIRAVVVDDSLAARELLVAILQGDADIEVIGVGANGEEAIRLTQRLLPDVITLDVRMPTLDGLEATRRIMCETPTPIVIVTADQVQQDANLTFEALRAGALTVVAKPSVGDAEACSRLAQTVRLMSEVPVVHHWHRQFGTAGHRAPPPGPAPQAPADGKDRWQQVEMIGIVSSTGGPAALATILGSLPADFAVPILVVQHVTNGFVDGLAEWLDNTTPLRVRLAEHGEKPPPATILLAPDDCHLQIDDDGLVKLGQEAPYKGLRPSANYMFHSLARAFGERAMGMVLTGMGDDGVEGLLALHQAGGITVAQDEHSCVVYGMPREACNRGAVDWVLPLDRIAPALRDAKGGGK